MKTVYWNFDKPHRCPECHTVVDAGRPTARAAVYECCACGTRFARWPRLAWLLPVRRCKDIAAGRCPHQAGGIPVTEKPAPSGDLRERLAEALYQHTLATARPTPFPPDLPEDPWLARARQADAARADAVLPVVEAETAALRERVETAERDVKREKAAHRMATQHAANADAREAEAEAEAARTQARYATERAARLREQAERLETERQRDEYRERFTNQMTAATELTDTLREAERQRDEALAAVEQVRRMAQVWIDIRPQHPTATTDAHTLAWAGEQIIAALDAEQPKETPPAEHVRGANAEDCPACSGRRDLPYPFICPGTAPAAPDTEDPVQCRTCESYILPDGIGWRHALGPADHTPEPAPDAEETR